MASTLRKKAPLNNDCTARKQVEAVSQEEGRAMWHAEPSKAHSSAFPSRGKGRIGLIMSRFT